MTDGEHIREEAMELYALGGLPEGEVEALKTHLAGCGECAMKLAQSRGSTAMLAFTAKQERPAGTIKAELMARVRANRERDEHYAWPLPTKEPVVESTTGETMTSKPTGARVWWNWVLVPTAVALALLSLALSWQNRRVSQALEKQRQAMQALLHDREQTEKLVGVLAAADTITVKLASAAEPVGNGVVKYNSRLGVMVYSAQLPPAPAGKTYQMWLVPANGAALSAGLLEKREHAAGHVWTAEVRANTEAKAFVVTLEPAGGVPQPTGPKVLVGAS